MSKLAYAFLREYSYKGLKLAQLLGQLGVFLTWAGPGRRTAQSLRAGGGGGGGGGGAPQPAALSGVRRAGARGGGARALRLEWRAAVHHGAGAPRAAPGRRHPAPWRTLRRFARGDSLSIGIARSLGARCAVGWPSSAKP
jgi:hypothetical protein